MGTIISITDADGNAITSNTHVAHLNPFRYRGYMYDEETGFYYLRSRYYDPTVGRFLNADALVSTGTGLMGYNMFTYCGDNPVMYYDSNGLSPCPWTTEHIRNYCAGMETCDEVNHNAKHSLLARIRDQEKSNPVSVLIDDKKCLQDNYKNINTMSVIARMLYGEDYTSIGAHMRLVENRQSAGNYGGSNYREIILSDVFGVQFLAMNGDRSPNPAALFEDPGEKDAWDMCVDAAFFYYVYGISYFDKDKHGYTYSKAYNNSCEITYPGGSVFGGTWFHN